MFIVYKNTLCKEKYKEKKKVSISPKYFLLELKMNGTLIQIVLILEKFDATAIQKGKESHITHVSKILLLM